MKKLDTGEIVNEVEHAALELLEACRRVGTGELKDAQSKLLDTALVIGSLEERDLHLAIAGALGLQLHRRSALRVEPVPVGEPRRKPAPRGPAAPLALRPMSPATQEPRPAPDRRPSARHPWRGRAAAPKSNPGGYK